MTTSAVGRGTTTSKGKRRPAVKTVRGPFVELPLHDDHCVDEEELRRLVKRVRAQEPERLIVADLFSGAGGLSLGLEQAGFLPVFAVDHDARAIKTHAHHFAGMSVDWDLADPNQVTRTGELLRSLDIDVVAGGPPCQPFSKAGRSMMRHLVREGIRDKHDVRRDLWRSFLEIIAIARPRAVLMENVPDMALDREMFILRSMAYELESLGYSVSERVVETRLFGVPQFRQRLILVALADRVAFAWPREPEERPKVDDAFADLPPIKGGERPKAGFHDYAPTGEVSLFARELRDGMSGEDAGRIYDHITRPVREDDEKIFDSMDHRTKYSDLDEDLKRYRDDIFDDKYKRLDPNDVSRTITAHIAKDGYWYIHPTQPRTISIREAARLQTFPDWFRFSGPPSAAFKQIGNAVPPRLGFHLGRAIADSLEAASREDHSTEEVAGSLAGFIRASPAFAVPWLNAESRFSALVGELLLQRTSHRDRRHVWPMLSRWTTPGRLLSRVDDVSRLGHLLGRAARAEGVIELAQLLEGQDHSLDDEGLVRLVELGVLTAAQAELAMLVCPDGESGEEPIHVRQGVLRVAARLYQSRVDVRNKLTDGRIAVASTVGFGDDARDAHLALIELAERVCRPTPDCDVCPIEAMCRSSQLGRADQLMIDFTA